MRSAILIAAACLAIAIVWLLYGSRIVLAFDHFFPGPPSPETTDRMVIANDRFATGKIGFPLPGPDLIQLSMDPKCRLVIRTGGRSFTLGTVKTWWTDPVNPQYLFVLDLGDIMSFTRDVSRVYWQTPFAWNILGATMPKRHRYAYDRIRWTKCYGSSFEIVWRSTQSFYPNGWADEWDFRVVKLSIHPGPVEKSAAAYLAKTKNWTEVDYRLEAQPSTPEDYIFTAIYLKDETAAHPGSGKSVALRINKSSKQISETAFQ